MPTRHYIASTEASNKAAAEITELVNRGLVSNLIAVDVETMPVVGLEGYPRKFEDENTGKTKWPTKRQWREYVVKLTQDNFDLGKLAALGVYLPVKFAGKNAKLQWESLYTTVNSFDPSEFSLKALKQGSTLDPRLWVHAVNVAEEGRIKVDPVQPGLDPYTTDIFTVQFTLRRKSDGELLSYIFNCAKVPLDGPKIVLALPNVTFLGANIKFDLKVFLHHIGFAPMNVWCSRIASRILTLGLLSSHSLAAVAKRYLGRSMDKTVRETFIGVRHNYLTDAQLEYAYEDTEVLFPLYDRMMAIARERGQEAVLNTFCRLSYPTAVWEYEGYLVDQTKWMEIYGQVVRKRDEIAGQLEELLLPPGYRALFEEAPEAGRLEVPGGPDSDDNGDAGDDESEVDGRAGAIIRISQTAVVKERLQAVLGLPVGSLDKDGRTTLEVEYKAKHKGETHPFFKLYEKWSKLAKQASTYGKKFLWAIHPLTGMIHPTFGIAGTDTARYTCTKPNLLNIPTPKGEDDVDFRAAFIAPEGYVFGNADYSAMEQRIAADLTGDPVLLALFASGGDSHSVTAAMMFHLRRAQVAEPRVVEDNFKMGTETIRIKVLEVPLKTTDAEMFAYATSEQVLSFVVKDFTRKVAKVVGFLFYFGGSAFTLAVRTNSPQEQAEDFFARFTTTYAVLAEQFNRFGMKPLTTQKVVDDDGDEWGYAEAYGGLRRWFSLPRNPSRQDFAPGIKGDFEFVRAQKEFKKRRGSIQREAKNLPTQGGNAVITAEAILRLWQKGKAMGVRPVLSIYDELLVLVPETANKERANALIEQAMVEPALKYFKRVDCVAEANPCTKVWAKH